jgi:hypothetical protein
VVAATPLFFWACKNNHQISKSTLLAIPESIFHPSCSATFFVLHWKSLTNHYLFCNYCEFFVVTITMASGTATVKVMSCNSHSSFDFYSFPPQHLHMFYVINLFSLTHSLTLSSFCCFQSVLSGDSLILVGKASNGPPPELSITLGLVQCPKIARGPSQVDEAFAWESREFLRALCVGKTVTFKVTQTVVSINRTFGDVLLDGVPIVKVCVGQSLLLQQRGS